MFCLFPVQPKEGRAPQIERAIFVVLLLREVIPVQALVRLVRPLEFLRVVGGLVCVFLQPSFAPAHSWAGFRVRAV